MTRQRMLDSQRWVVKVGSSLLTKDGAGLDHELIADWCAQIAEIVADGVEVILVSSGSIAEGMLRLSLPEKPSDLPTLQAAAAVGQMGLIHTYEREFDTHRLRTAQVLLTHEDLANRQRYLNARATLRRLLELKVIPIINENDTVTNEEIRFGDNDTLGALVANLVTADALIILTDQNGLYTADPRDDNSALGSGGMRTKVLAAQRAADSGTTTIIASGRETGVLKALRAGKPVGTMFTSSQPARVARKQWLASQLKSRGKLWLDAGAAAALTERGVSLLAVGVTRVEGEFRRGELVSCLSPDGSEIARGLSNYGSVSSGKIAGRASEEFDRILGYSNETELINRDNLVLVQSQ